MGGVAGDAGSAGGGLRVAIVLGGVLKVEVRLTGGHVLWVSSCETKGKERGGWCFGERNPSRAGHRVAPQECFTGKL